MLHIQSFPFCPHASPVLAERAAPTEACVLSPCLLPILQEIKAKINALQQAVMKIGENLSGGGGGDAGGSGGGENVQDAEVKDKQ